MIGLADFQISTLLHSVSARQGISRRAFPASNDQSEGRAPFANPALKTLVKGLEITNKNGNLDSQVTCLITDSRRVVPGALFFAISGLQADGNTFVEEALDRGAVAVVSSVPCGRNFPIPYLQVEDVRVALAEISARFYEHPDRALSLFGITGTNGKTTVSMLLQHFLGGREAVGMLGTVRYDLGKRTLPSFRTTPESVDTFAMLDQIRRAGCARAVMEVSSHGLVQKRLYGMRMGATAFLNLTQDHLDYHETMEAYYEAKKLLFNGGNGQLPKHAVINIDCPHGKRLVDELPKGVEAITIGLNAKADIFASSLSATATGTQFELNFGGERRSISSPLLGTYNVSNFLAAFALARVAGESADDIIARLDSFPGVAGRMERIANDKGFNVVVDYAHTEDALTCALSMLREITPGRIHTVFGCGGDRDRSKRPLMARAVEAGSDTVYATSDNPRSEAIATIFEDMRQGFTAPEKIVFESDRRLAIERAIASAAPGDCVFIAGKGHETYQEMAGSIIPFDDRRVAREFIKQLSR